MNALSWIGTITSIIGAFIVALHFLAIGYVFFLIGSISWLTVGYARRDWSIFVLNSFFFAANVIGAYNAV